LSGTKPGFIQYPAGTYAFNQDKSNVAPSGGVAWQLPGTEHGLGRMLFGSQEGDSVIRGGAAMAFQRPGMSDFTGVFGANQGIAVNLIRDSTNVIGPLPVLLRNANQLALPAAPAATYPIFPTAITNSVNMFDANLRNPYTQSYTLGWQRKLGQDTAFELRYVGSRHRQDWETVNLNEVSITDNGFASEFRKAQANLQANIAANKGATFAYTGAPGTSPLPIFLAYLNGANSSQAGDATKYSGANWTNTGFVGYLAAQNPNPFGFMCNNGLTGCTTATLTNGFIGNTTFRNNAAAAGLPSNFFLANPDMLGGANLTTNSGGTHANSIQMEFRKRLSNGLTYNVSYTWADAFVQQRFGFAKPLQDVQQTGQTGNVQHALKSNWLYELPFGEGKRWGGGSGGLMNALAGGWSINGVARIQTGEQIDFGNVRLVGMTQDELQKSVALRVASTGQIFILPDDIIQNTVKAFNVSATSANGYGALGAPTGRYMAPANGPDCIETSPGYGDCGLRSLVVNAPRLVRFDLVAAKTVKVGGGWSAEFRVEMLNALNSPYFNPASTAGTPLGFTAPFTTPGGPVLTGTPIQNSFAGTSADSFRMTSLLGDNTAGTFRIIQLVWRVRW
jgi:hypothetical protein